MIGATDTKSTKATPKKAHKISSQNANEELLDSEVNAVSTDKGKQQKQPGGKKKKKGRKKKQDESSPEKPSTNPSGQRKPPRGVMYVMRIIGREIVHIKLKLRNSLRVQKPQQY